MAGRNEHFLEPQTLDVWLTWPGLVERIYWWRSNPQSKWPNSTEHPSDFTSNSIWSSWNTFFFGRWPLKKNCLLSLTSSNWFVMFVTIHPDLCRPSMFYLCFSSKAAWFGKRSEWKTKKQKSWSWMIFFTEWTSREVHPVDFSKQKRFTRPFL